MHPMYPMYPYYGMPESYMDMYYDNSGLAEMYPDVYRRVQPRVTEICDQYDIWGNPRMYPRVDPRLVEEMVETVYRREITQPYAQQFTARGIFRDLITILIIQNLLGRRRRRGYGYFF
ncbi:hypothetical protein [Serpentinicella alkaliphila]|uniref:Uncharacterized protein n=1 Tax=Serpentinicella alkaliphila TaxID=1734049 RepID=A0A4R2TGB3_9FIRM|nr:hypothetical protein [Serpentinicella alkaliphila]QUH25091.1 hypothetical protein HZR23_04340 [Serpentinicella alkaliphila]TCQ01736.1 hypothetical protein EDD79_102310 [Serpentinicella alkaliphila]